MHHDLYELLPYRGKYDAVIIGLRRGDSVNDPNRPGKVIRGPLRGTLHVKATRWADGGITIAVIG